MSELNVPVYVEMYPTGDGQLVITAETYYEDRDLALTRIELFYMLFPEKVLTRRAPTVETEHDMSKASCRFVVEQPPPGLIMCERHGIVSTPFKLGGVVRVPVTPTKRNPALDQYTEVVQPMTHEEAPGFEREVLEAMLSENTRLQKLVRSAFEEGLREGATVATTRYGGKSWEESEAKKDLEA